MISIAPRIIFAIAVFAAAVQPAAAAGTRYMLYEGWGYPQSLVAGPFYSLTDCQAVQNQGSAKTGRYDYHCDILP